MVANSRRNVMKGLPLKSQERVIRKIFTMIPKKRSAPISADAGIKTRSPANS